MKQSGSSNFLNIASWQFTPYQILTLGFAALILSGALLLMTPAATVTGRLGFVDALFTATSAACVTGLVVVDTGTYFTLFGQTVIILLIQIGGFGIMTMATLMALLMRKRIQLRERLIMQEAMNQLTVAGIVRLTIYVVKVGLAIEFIGGTILAARFYQDYGPEGIYFGYWHAVSAFCNAGFDLLGNFNSLTRYVGDGWVILPISVLIILGGLGFSVLADLLERRKDRAARFTLHTKVVLSTTAILIVLGTVVIFCLEYDNPQTLRGLAWQGKLLGSYFQSVTVRTAGYCSINIGALSGSTLFFMVLLMFIGASPGSTGGGVKTTTLAVLAAAIWALISGREDPQMFYRRIPQNVVYKSFAVVFIAAALVVLVTMMLSVSEPFPFINILFEVVSAFSTTGVSTGITPQLSAHAKIWLIFTMFAGRVGPVTLALALALRGGKKVIQYPEGKITIG